MWSCTFFVIVVTLVNCGFCFGNTWNLNCASIAGIGSDNLNKSRSNAFPLDETVKWIRISSDYPNNGLHALPMQPSGLLEGLWINDCGLISLPHDLLFESKNLQNISFAHNNLTEIPSNIFKNQVNLKQLDLSFNELISLDDNLFRKTKNLHVLRLSYNRLSNISRYV